VRTFLIVVVAWLACSVFDRGYLIGGFTQRFPSQRNDVGATMFSLAGPFAVPEAAYFYLSDAPYMWRGYTCQQRWEAQDYKGLGKHYFVTHGGNFDCRVEDLSP